MRGVRLAVLDIAIVALIALWWPKLPLAAWFQGLFVGNTAVLSVPYADLITHAATQHGLEPALLAGLVQVESSFNPDAVSPSGAMGLTQIMPQTAGELGLERPFDAAENLDAGARYLAWLIDYFEGDVRLAVMAYHGGPGRIAAGEERPIDVQYAADVLAAKEVISGQYSVPSVQLPYAAGERVVMTQGWHGLVGWEGVDYAAGCGAVLVAPISGRVTYNGLDGYVGPHSRNGEQSSMLTIENGRLAVTMLHGDYGRVRAGEWVQQGQVVGFEDKIGNATGCHTHLVVKVDEVAIGMGR